MRGIIATVAVVTFVFTSALVTGMPSASSAEPNVVKKIKTYPLPIFEAPEASPEKLKGQLKKKELSDVEFPLPILEAADNGMYLVEINGERVWVLDNFVQVDTTAKASVLGAEAMGFSDKDLGASRGYGEGD